MGEMQLQGSRLQDGQGPPEEGEDPPLHTEPLQPGWPTCTSGLQNGTEGLCLRLLSWPPQGPLHRGAWQGPQCSGGMDTGDRAWTALPHSSTAHLVPTVLHPLGGSNFQGQRLGFSCLVTSPAAPSPQGLQVPSHPQGTELPRPHSGHSWGLSGSL